MVSLTIMNDSGLKATMTGTGGTGTPKKAYTTRNLSTALQAVALKAEQPRKFHLLLCNLEGFFSEVLYMVNLKRSSSID